MLMAFSRSGRESVMVATPRSSRSNSTDTGGVWQAARDDEKRRAVAARRRRRYRERVNDLRPVGMARQPVALGCFLMAALAAVIVGLGIVLVAWLNSGSTTVALDDARAYAVGSVEFVPARNVFVVRLTETEYLVLDDLDAANRANQGRRCRVQPLAAADPARAALVTQYASRMNPKAAGSTFVFVEACNNAVYDVTGLRLDRDGPNLDRHPVDIDSEGRLTVNIARRTCTQRLAGNLAAPRECEQ